MYDDLRRANHKLCRAYVYTVTVNAIATNCHHCKTRQWKHHPGASLQLLLGRCPLDHCSECGAAQAPGPCSHAPRAACPSLVALAFLRRRFSGKDIIDLKWNGFRGGFSLGANFPESLKNHGTYCQLGLGADTGRCTEHRELPSALLKEILSILQEECFLANLLTFVELIRYKPDTRPGSPVADDPCAAGGDVSAGGDCSNPGDNINSQLIDPEIVEKSPLDVFLNSCLGDCSTFNSHNFTQGEKITGDRKSTYVNYSAFDRDKEHPTPKKFCKSRLQKHTPGSKLFKAQSNPGFSDYVKNVKEISSFEFGKHNIGTLDNKYSNAFSLKHQSNIQIKATDCSNKKHSSVSNIAPIIEVTTINDISSKKPTAFDSGNGHTGYNVFESICQPLKTVSDFNSAESGSVIQTPIYPKREPQHAECRSIKAQDMNNLIERDTLDTKDCIWECLASQPRITYKKNPSKLGDSKTSVFVFPHRSATVSKQPSSWDGGSKMIPLDFNLNAVYKLSSGHDYLDLARPVAPLTPGLPSMSSMASFASLTNADPGYDSPPPISCCPLEDKMALVPHAGQGEGAQTHPSKPQAHPSKPQTHPSKPQTHPSKSQTQPGKQITPIRPQNVMSTVYELYIKRFKDHPLASHLMELLPRQPGAAVGVSSALALVTCLLLGVDVAPCLYFLWEVLLHLALVLLLVTIVFFALEANNLTDTALQQVTWAVSLCSHAPYSDVTAGDCARTPASGGCSTDTGALRSNPMTNAVNTQPNIGQVNTSSENLSDITDIGSVDKLVQDHAPVKWENNTDVKDDSTACLVKPTVCFDECPGGSVDVIANALCGDVISNTLSTDVITRSMSDDVIVDHHHSDHPKVLQTKLLPNQPRNVINKQEAECSPECLTRPQEHPTSPSKSKETETLTSKSSVNQSDLTSAIPETPAVSTGITPPLVTTVVSTTSKSCDTTDLAEQFRDDRRNELNEKRDVKSTLVGSDASTMTDTPDDNIGSNDQNQSEANVMTEVVTWSSAATQTECGDDDESLDDAGVFLVELPETGVPTADASVSAELDVKRLYQKIERLQQRHEAGVRRLRRKFLAVRRKCQVEAKDMKSSHQRKSEVLTRLQLSIPVLQKEKNALCAERETVEQQYEDEKKKNRELVGRLTQLKQQFYRLGQIHQGPPPGHWLPHPPLPTTPTTPAPRPAADGQNSVVTKAPVTVVQKQMSQLPGQPAPHAGQCPHQIVQPVHQAVQPLPQTVHFIHQAGQSPTQTVQPIHPTGQPPPPAIQTLPPPPHPPAAQPHPLASRFSHFGQQHALPPSHPLTVHPQQYPEQQHQQQYPPPQPTSQQSRLPIFQLFNKTFSQPQHDGPTSQIHMLVKNQQELQLQQKSVQQQKQQVPCHIQPSQLQQRPNGMTCHSNK